MDMLKREWKVIGIVLWLIIITLLLFSLSGKINRIQAQNDKIADVLDTVEGVVIGADSGAQEVLKRMEGVESQINYIVKKVRRR